MSATGSGAGSEEGSGAGYGSGSGAGSEEGSGAGYKAGTVGQGLLQAPNSHTQSSEPSVLCSNEFLAFRYLCTITFTFVPLIPYLCTSLLLQVAPWVVDVTDAALGGGAERGREGGPAALVPSGGGDGGGGAAHGPRQQQLAISYRGLYRGRDPPPGVSGAYIMMESCLVLLPAAPGDATTV